MIVRFFGPLRAACGVSEFEVDAQCLDDVIARCDELYPETFSLWLPSCKVVEEEGLTAFLPPVGGGQLWQ